MEKTMRIPIIAVGLVAVSASPVLAQFGNPAVLAPDTMMQSPGVPAPNQTNTTDRLFAQLAAAGGMAEVEFGKIAGDKAEAPGVKDFARMMVEDHGEASKTLISIADKSKIPLPKVLDKDHENLRRDLEKLDGASFDLTYLRLQVVDHQKTVQLLEWEIGSGEDAELQRFAAETLPTVLHHLEVARELVADLSGQASAQADSEPAKIK
jgi:putative membrane protein